MKYCEFGLKNILNTFLFNYCPSLLIINIESFFALASLVEIILKNFYESFWVLLPKLLGNNYETFYEVLMPFLHGIVFS